MEAPIRTAPVTPVRTLAPSQRRFTSHLSISGAAMPLVLSGGSCPRSMPDDRCEASLRKLLAWLSSGGRGLMISVWCRCGWVAVTDTRGHLAHETTTAQVIDKLGRRANSPGKEVPEKKCRPRLCFIPHCVGSEAGAEKPVRHARWRRIGSPVKKLSQAR